MVQWIARRIRAARTRTCLCLKSYNSGRVGKWFTLAACGPIGSSLISANGPYIVAARDSHHEGKANSTAQTSKVSLFGNIQAYW